MTHIRQPTLDEQKFLDDFGYDHDTSQNLGLDRAAENVLARRISSRPSIQLSSLKEIGDALAAVIDINGESKENDKEEEDDAEKQHLSPKQMRRGSIIDLPSFRIHTDFDEATFEAERYLDSVDLGARRYGARIVAVTPKSFDIKTERKCILAVSLGSQNTELARLDAMLQYVASEFDECTIMTGDYIYRLTAQLKFGLTQAEATQAAIEAGYQYRATCSAITSQYQDLCKFKWRSMSDIVKEHPKQYEESYRQMKAMYENEKPFRQSVGIFSQAYVNRTGVDNAFNSTETPAITLKYLLEECAIFNCMCMEGPTTLVYAGSIKSIEDLCDGKFEGTPQPIKEGKLRFVSMELSAKGYFFPSKERKVIKVGGLLVGSMEDRELFPGSIFDTFDEESKIKLMKAGVIKKIRNGMALLKQGEVAKEKVIILEGWAEELVERQDGTYQRLKFLKAGSVVGLESILDEQPSSALVNSMSDVTVLKFSNKSFDALEEKHPELVNKLWKGMGRLQSLRARRHLYEFQHMRLDINRPVDM